MALRGGSSIQWIFGARCRRRSAGLAGEQTAQTLCGKYRGTSKQTEKKNTARARIDDGHPIRISNRPIRFRSQIGKSFMKGDNYLYFQLVTDAIERFT